MTGPVHTPILTGEILELLALAPGDSCIDATINGGGHTAAILAATEPHGRVLGIDRDPEILQHARQRFQSEIAAGRLVLVHGSFANLGEIATSNGFTGVAAVVFDLGASSFHFDFAQRGFTFRRDEPLDMRFDPTDASLRTAADLVNSLEVRQLASLIARYGEERYAWRIARSIERRRPLRTTSELYAAIAAALPGPVRWRSARSAARVFQALRIAVNGELHALEAALPQAVSLLRPGGKLVLVCFHSLEDRIVKNFLRAQEQHGAVRILTKKPLRPSDEEISANPRAASAKLRACERRG
ncbi:MAG: 16S rRNA (cytosine(1402)-N(4))-methyltransferase RsmH [Candidatus Binatia bacterium]|nr:16S rRNA (cytosine(1402)-N(4))-methyltransferase RsmH [Candidatus Binatia bacterium]